MVGPIHIYTGENHASWDEDGWVWFMAARDEAYCAVRITPGEHRKLSDEAGNFSAFIARLEQIAATIEPRPDPIYNQVYDVGTQPVADPAEILVDWLASLYFVDPSQGASAKSEWQASGSTLAMVVKAIGWDPERFRGAYLMGNAGLLYGPDQIRQIATLHGVVPGDARDMIARGNLPD